MNRDRISDAPSDTNSATRLITAASTTNATMRVTGRCTDPRRSFRLGPRVGLGVAAIGGTSVTGHDAMSRPLEPVVGAARASADLSPSIGEPEALLGDRGGHRRAVSDLVDEVPQPVARQQLSTKWSNSRRRRSRRRAASRRRCPAPAGAPPGPARSRASRRAAVRARGLRRPVSGLSVAAAARPPIPPSGWKPRERGFSLRSRPSRAEAIVASGRTGLSSHSDDARQPHSRTIYHQ